MNSCVIISPRESRLCGRGLVLSYFHWIYLVGRLYEFRPVHMCCLWIPWFVQVSLCPSILPRDSMKGVMKFPHLLSSPCLIGQTNSVKIHNLMTSDRLIIEDQYLLLRGTGYFVLRRFVCETCILSLYESLYCTARNASNVFVVLWRSKQELKFESNDSITTSCLRRLLFEQLAH